jgi:hypothetical protein
MMEGQAEPQQQQQPAEQTMQHVTITPMPGFCPDAKIGTSLSTRWNNWQSNFEMYLASGITDSKRKRAHLLYHTLDCMRVLKKSPRGELIRTTISRNKGLFLPQQNWRYEVYRFRQTTQEHNKTFDQFHSRFRTMSETREFSDVEFEIEEQIIIGGN